jgi:DtxR family transcriptional regulator, Mn-dependent transcriptional regulator
MASLTVENYVKAIFVLSGQGSDHAATGQIAAALGVSPGTVTSMLKTLSESALATYTPYEGARLTPSGAALALRVIRRHRLIELFLVKTLGLSWSEVHDEAEHLEHAVGYPHVDPHGDPIPKSDGTLEPATLRSLADCAPGEPFRLARVLDQSPEFLNYLTSVGLLLGAAGTVTSNRNEAGTVELTVNGKAATLGQSAARSLAVETPARTG